MRRTRYDMEALHRRGGGAYWYRSGWNPVALVALVLGTVVAALFANSTLYVGPLVRLIDGGDISIFAGFLVAAAIYYTGMRGRLAEASR
jgi:nucleobase:cation symporter-1, NCS1 family